MAEPAAFLERLYALVFFDAIRVKVRDEGMVRNKAVYVALSGFDPTEPRKSSACGSSKTEGAKFWLRVMNELKNCGVEDVLIAVVDGLKGFPEAITAVFPQTQVQTCIVHLIRNSLDFVSYKDRKAVAKIPGNRPVLATPLERGHPVLRFPRRSASDHLYDKRNRVIERQIAPSSSRPRPFPHRRERAEASFSRVEPGAKRMENAAARMGHGESAIRDHIRGQVQVGATKF